MKKLLLLTLALALCTSAMAQKNNKTGPYKFFFVSSGMTLAPGATRSPFLTGYSYEKDDNFKYERWGVNPEFGWMITDDFWLAAGLGYSRMTMNGVKTDFFGINPYICQVFYKAGNFSIFAMADVMYGRTKIKNGDSYNTWGGGVNAIASYSLSDRFCITTAIAGATFKKQEDARSFDLNIIGTNGLSFSLIYCFGKR